MTDNTLLTEVLRHLLASVGLCSMKFKPHLGPENMLRVLVWHSSGYNTWHRWHLNGTSISAAVVRQTGTAGWLSQLWGLLVESAPHHFKADKQCPAVAAPAK